MKRTRALLLRCVIIILACALLAASLLRLTSAFALHRGRDMLVLAAKGSLTTELADMAISCIDECDAARGSIAFAVRGDNGEIMSIELDRAKLAALTLSVTERANGYLGGASLKLSLPVCVLIFGFGSYDGLKLGYRLPFSGEATAEIKSELTGSGVNQSRHRVTLEIRAAVSLIFPSGNELIELCLEVPVAETVFSNVLADK